MIPMCSQDGEPLVWTTVSLIPFYALETCPQPLSLSRTRAMSLVSMACGCVILGIQNGRQQMSASVCVCVCICAYKCVCTYLSTFENTTLRVTSESSDWLWAPFTHVYLFTRYCQTPTRFQEVCQDILAPSTCAWWKKLVWKNQKVKISTPQCLLALLETQKAHVHIHTHTHARTNKCMVLIIQHQHCWS